GSRDLKKKNNLVKRSMTNFVPNAKEICLKITYGCPAVGADATVRLFGESKKLQSYARKARQVFHIFTDSDYTEAKWIADMISEGLGMFEPVTVSNYISKTISL